MHLDVLDLRNFYYRTRLGRVAQRAVRDQLTAIWPPETVHGMAMAGFGFAVPLLRPYLGRARRVMALMPAQQGVMAWPAGQPNVSVLTEEMRWPVDTGSLDRVVLMHGLETSENPSALLDELWRVLGPGGRALIVVPNRSGLWARRDVTPFGFGRPYSPSQLEGQLQRHDFVPARHVAALFAPPSDRPFWLRSAALIERVGRQVSNSLAGGVFLIEASKTGPQGGLRVTRETLRPILVPQGAPAPSFRDPGFRARSMRRCR